MRSTLDLALKGSYELHDTQVFDIVRFVNNIAMNRDRKARKVCMPGPLVAGISSRTYTLIPYTLIAKGECLLKFTLSRLWSQVLNPRLIGVMISW